MHARYTVRSALLLVAALALAACSSSATPPSPPTTVNVDGPLDYVAIARRLSGPAGMAQHPLGSPVRAGSGAVSGDVAATTGVIAAICPEAAPVLGPVSAISTWVNGNQVAGEISTINSQLTFQQGEINTLQGQVTSLNQAYLSLVASNAMNGACGALRNWVALQQDVYAPGVSLANSTNCGNGFTNGSVIASLGYEFYQAALNDSSSPSPTATLATTANLNYNALSSAQMKTLNGLVVSSLLPSGMSVATAASDLSMSDAASAYQPNMGLSPYADGPTTLQAQIKNIRNGIQSEMTTPIGDCSTGASSNTTSLLLACAYQAFITNDLPQQGTAYGSNVITLIADWNQYVMSVYQQNLIALTYLYDVEAISNYMNFYQWNQYLTAQICLMTSPPSWATCPASPGPSTAVPFQQINPWETLPVSFSVGSAIGQTPPKSLGMSCTGSTPSVSTCTINANSNSSSQNPLTLTQTSFLQAQQNLAVLYAQRVNYLYQGVMSFIISDPPLSTQSYTTAPPSQTIQASTTSASDSGTLTVTYPAQSSLYKTIPAANLGAIAPTGTYQAGMVVPGQNIIGIATGNNPTVIPAQSSAGVLYQYQGVNNLYSCTGRSALTRNASAQETVTLTNCTTPFPSTAGGYYDGLNMQAYAMNGSVPAGAVLTNSTDGWASTATGTLDTPSIFLWAWLIPSTWGGTNLVNSSMASSTTQPFGFGSSCSSSSGGCMGYWEGVTGGIGKSYDYYVASNSLASPSLSYPNFSLVASSSSSSPYYGYGNGNFYVTGSGSSWQLHDGGLSGSAPQPDHVALLQVTLPNGYNLPFYIVTANIYDTSSTPVCPGMMSANAWPPGLSNCWQQNAGSGGIGVQTADGNVYYVNVSSDVSISGNGSVALSVSTSPASSPAYSAYGIAAPSGTYTESCTNISWNGAMLTASCKNDSGHYVSASIQYAPGTFPYGFYCTYGSTVSNSNGNLVCN